MLTPTRCVRLNLKKDVGAQYDLAPREPERVQKMASLMGRMLRERKAQMPSYKKGNSVGAPAGSVVPWPDEVKGDNN